MSLQLCDMARPLRPLTILDFWLDNLMANIPALTHTHTHTLTLTLTLTLTNAAGVTRAARRDAARALAWLAAEPQVGPASNPDPNTNPNPNPNPNPNQCGRGDARG